MKPNKQSIYEKMHAQEGQGRSMADLAREYGVTVNAFYSWKYQRGKKAAKPKRKKHKMREIELPALETRPSGKLMVVFGSAHELMDLVRAYQ